MFFLRRLIERNRLSVTDQGPLFEQVRKEMSGVQAYARSHGGEIQLLSVTEEGDVHIRLTGTCRGCPMSAVTIKLGVENHLRQAVPGIRRVIQKL